MTAAIVFGAAVAVSGWLAASAIAAAHTERILGRLAGSEGVPRSPRRTGSRLGRAIARRAERRGWPGGHLGYAMSVAGASAAGLALGFRLAGPVGAIAGLAGGPLAIEAFLTSRSSRATRTAEEQLREAVNALAAGVRAGLSTRRALAEAARDSNPPLRGELERVLNDLDVGEPLDVALARLAERLRLVDARLLVTSLTVHARTGGDLPSLLDEASAIIGQRVDSRRQVRALTAQGRASGAVLAVLPVAFVALLSWTGGDGLGAFYRTPLGAGLLVAGLVCEGLGFLWIRRIVRAGAESG